MAEYVNTLSHGVVVRDPDSPRDDGLRRIAPGARVEASGDLEKTLKDVRGVESTSSKEGKAYVDAHPSSEYSDTPATTDVVGGALASARAAAKRFLAVTNQVVIGDDEAPHGPPTGTVTTKHAIVEGTAPGDPERVAFADHEAVVADVEGKAVSDVARAQAEDTQAVDELTRSILEADPEELQETASRSLSGGGFGPRESEGQANSGRAENQAGDNDSSSDE